MIYTVSSIREFRSCRRRFKHKYVDLVRAALEGKARLIGTASHGGFDQLWLGHASPVLDFSNSYWLSEAGLIEKARTEALVGAYWERWGSECPGWSDVSAEEVFTIEIGGFTVAGKLDKRARFDGHPFLVEHKTTSDDIATLGDDYWQRIALDLQIAIYQEAVERKYGERPIVLYDVVKKPLGKPKQKDRKTKEVESLDEFKDRMKATMLESPDEYLVRRVVHRSAEQQEALIAEAIATMQEMQQAAVFERNDSACVSPYGACAFLGVCTGTEQLDSPRFVTLGDPHPELDGEIKKEDVNGSRSLSAECPI